MAPLFTLRCPFFQYRVSFFALALVFLRAPQVLAESPLTLQTECHTPATAVAVSLDVDGTITLTGEGKTQTVPLGVAAKFAYEEMRLDDGKPKSAVRAARFYSAADAKFEINKQPVVPHLDDEHRLMLAEDSSTGFVISSPAGPLTREELDLVDIPGNTLYLDCLLPSEDTAKDVKIGDSWAPADKSLARLLGIDIVSRNELKCSVRDADDKGETISISGTVAGAVMGVATEMQLDGEAKSDSQRRRIVSLQLRIKEQRAAGHTSPATDVVAKLKIDAAPVEECKDLTADVVKGLPTEPAKATPPLILHPASAGLQLVYDRRWQTTRDEQTVTVLRLVDRGELVAQCNVSLLANPSGKPTSLEDFQGDVQKVLGSHFGSFDSVEASKSAAGLQVYRATVSGKVSDLPIQWRYYLVQDEHGHKAALTYTMEQDLVERFSELDAQMIDSLAFVEPKPAK